jgi:ABC-type multidrug transport system fused ATPase/permease subunit
VIRYLQEILQLLAGERHKLPWLFLLFLGSSLLDFIGIGLVGPYVALLMDERALDGMLGDLVAAMGVARDQRTALAAVGLVLLAIFVAKAVAAIGVQRAVIRFSQEQQMRVQSVLMHSYQELPYEKFLLRNSADYVYAIAELAPVFATVVNFCLRIASDTILIIVLLALLAAQNAAALALLAALVLAVVFGYDRLFRRRLRRYGENRNRSGIDSVRAIHEGIEGLKEIRVLGKEGHFHRRLEEAATEYAHFATRAALIAAAPRYLLEAVMVLFVVALVLLVLLLGSDPQKLVPTLGMFGVAALRLMPAASTISTNLIQLRYQRDAISRLHRDLCGARAASHSPVPSTVGVGEPFEALTLADVHLTYPDASRAALDGLSMEVRAGDSIGLVGPSGSGKTTLVDVLLGLLDPQRGELLYNGRPLAREIATWRAQVAYLPQQVFLIDDTLRRNVALGVPDSEIDEHRLREALRQARLTDLVEQLPHGRDTLIGERGARLSGGQRQRVALARAFYHGRNVLVMDEATSALDQETEREIVEEIQRLKGLKTVIVIAHRLTTVRHCDRIYRLVEGRIVEHGTYNEVIGESDIR